MKRAHQLARIEIARADLYGNKLAVNVCKMITTCTSTATSQSIGIPWLRKSSLCLNGKGWDLREPIGVSKCGFRAVDG